MNFLYLLLNIGSIAVPFAFSFHPRLKFYRHWRSFGIGILVMMALFITWDIIFTKNGVWGFNPNYLVGIDIINLPLEEWLFFICIPYACIFTHYALLEINPKFGLNLNTTKLITVILLVVFFTTAIFNIDKNYTFVNFGLGGIVLLLVLVKNIKLLQQFFISYAIIFFPFLLINGILTGSFIEGEVVWYNNDENLGIRIFTIPIEDSVYALSMLLIPLFIMTKLKPSSEQLTIN